MPRRSLVMLFMLRARVASLLAVVLAGCASTEPGLASVRQVFLSTTPSIGGTYSSEFLVGTRTDRFGAQDAFGYVYIVFNGGNSHEVRFKLKNETETVVYASPQLRLLGSARSPKWLGNSFRFPVAGTLGPGNYRLELTIDDQSAGVYPFRVDDRRSG